MKDKILDYIRTHEGCLASEIDYDLNCGGNMALEAKPNLVTWMFNLEAATAISELIEEQKIIIDLADKITMVTGPMLLKMPFVTLKAGQRAAKGILKTPHWIPSLFYTEPYAKSKGIKPLVGVITP